MDRKEAYVYLGVQGNGKTAELITMVGEELYKEMRTMGFISVTNEDWKISSRGLKEYEFYRDSTEEEKDLGTQLANLGF